MRKTLPWPCHGRRRQAQTASAIPAHIERTRLKFPDNYTTDFVLYDTISFPERNQVRKYFADAAAIEAICDCMPK